MADNEIWRLEYSKLAEQHGCYPFHITLANSLCLSDNTWSRSWETIFLGKFDDAWNKLEQLAIEYEKREEENRALSTLPSSHKKRIRFLILKRDGYRCQICGRGASDNVSLEIGHKVARANGGTYDESNLVTLCFDCNRGQQTDEF